MIIAKLGKDMFSQYVAGLASLDHGLVPFRLLLLASENRLMKLKILSVIKFLTVLVAKC